MVYMRALKSVPDFFGCGFYEALAQFSSHKWSLFLLGCSLRQILKLQLVFSW